ncbi:SF-assemblin, putative [Plasmodium knowlesi strain H]|uniref:SF-assemblin, putative n=3 Tax=Plasmodium knowlesi TaxID=5850 RepID=A0A1A7VZZ4_PLAKH|nr:filament assembling protein, putative [Plasmodium knowlesi strain H]OTN68708.1 putative SF-assemblin [Plasmodium knowlesi]CAA9986238.1 filament assembling protein, putative [Plasmodium knowlesi strain H]SBO25449.1 SF-assemblin, putative [Plasmodium knowlesi strain H]SBO27728.1 SF-assemblin, putative [Plasmodium knowlesi strain H]VVS75712.1 filament assembling protein, putative [Plasmodium knowlesi strain H]
MFDINEPSIRNKRDTESEKKSDDNVSIYNSEESMHNFGKGGKGSSYCSGERGNADKFKLHDGEDDHAEVISKGSSKSSSKGSSNGKGDDSENIGDYFGGRDSLYNKGEGKKKEKSLIRNGSEFFISEDEMRSSNMSTDMNSDLRKAQSKVLVSRHKTKKSGQERNRREGMRAYKADDISPLQENSFVGNRNFNQSLNLTKNDIMYFCEGGRMLKRDFVEGGMSKSGLKLNMGGGNHISGGTHMSVGTHATSTTYHEDGPLFNAAKLRTDREKVQRNPNLGCSLKKATRSGGYEGETRTNSGDGDGDDCGDNCSDNRAGGLLFAEVTKRSMEVKGKCINNNTKIKIKRLCEKIEGFEKEIKNEILQKKNVEKEKIFVIREAINKLEKNLNNEIKKRIEHNRTIQSIFSSEILKVQEKIENVVKDKVDEIEKAIKALDNKVDTIASNIESEKMKCIQNLEKRNNSIARDFSSLQAAFQQDKASNKEKESSICKKLEELERKSENRITAEKNIRDNKYQEIISYIEEIKRERKGKNENFQNFVMEEIATIKNGLILESQAREAADDDIVQAVNHYTKALQDSLRLINSN